MDDDGQTSYAVAQLSSRIPEADPPFASAGGHRVLQHGESDVETLTAAFESTEY
jgi:hypothetical protein